MRSFGNLVINEWLKMYKKKSFFLAYALLAAIVVFIGYMMVTFEKDSMETGMEFAKLAVSSKGLGHVLTILAIALTAGSLTKEHSYGTIKLLLIRAQSRSKILASKYAVILIYVISLIAFMLAVGFATGAALFGMGEGSTTWQDVVMAAVYNLVYTMLYVTFAFAISIVTRSIGPAVGIGMFMVVIQGSVNQFLVRYAWYKYLPFINADLSMYSGGSAGPIPGMTLTFSAAVLAVYLLLFLFVGFVTFKKQDIA